MRLFILFLMPLKACILGIFTILFFLSSRLWENTPSVTHGSPNLIREGGRTVGSGRVAAIIE